MSLIESVEYPGRGLARELTAAREQQPDLQLAPRQLTYEPDPPIRTPRITAAATITGTELTVRLDQQTFADVRTNSR